MVGGIIVSRVEGVICAYRLRGMRSLNGSSVIQPRLTGGKVLNERREYLTPDPPITLVFNSDIRWLHIGARRTRLQLEQGSG